jgi:hypothetical protein
LIIQRMESLPDEWWWCVSCSFYMPGLIQCDCSWVSSTGNDENRLETLFFLCWNSTMYHSAMSLWIRRWNERWNVNEMAGQWT